MLQIVRFICDFVRFASDKTRVLQKRRSKPVVIAMGDPA
jgi:hypothetical protein